MTAWCLAAAALTAGCGGGASDEALVPADGVYTVPLSYRAPAEGQPAPRFSPKGTQVPLGPAPEGLALPDGASPPVRVGTLQVGESAEAWVPVLVASDPAHPKDLTRLYFDLNRNGNFEDDADGRFEAVPSQNERTGDWWSSFSDISLQVPYASGAIEPFMVDAWIVRSGDVTPDIMRFSRRSWRAGSVEVEGVPALVAVMDADNDAVFTDRDTWSVIEASADDAEQAVLSIGEARDTSRMMFVRGGDREVVLEFRGIAPDGSSVSFAAVDVPMTKAEDRLADDTVADERARPRAATPVTWLHGLDEALAAARASGRPVLIDFEAVWCGPCKTMDEWIWTDAEVAAAISGGFVGVKIDGDLDAAIAERYEVVGYPTMMIIDGAGVEQRRVVGYKTSAEMLRFLAGEG